MAGGTGGSCLAVPGSAARPQELGDFGKVLCPRRMPGRSGGAPGGRENVRAPLGERARLGAQCLSAPPPSPSASAGRLASGLCPRIPGDRFPGTPWLPRCCPGRSPFRVWLQLGLNFTHQS